MVPKTDRHISDYRNQELPTPLYRLFLLIQEDFSNCSFRISPQPPNGLNSPRKQTVFGAVRSFLYSQQGRFREPEKGGGTCRACQSISRKNGRSSLMSVDERSIARPAESASGPASRAFGPLLSTARNIYPNEGVRTMKIGRVHV